MARTDGGFESSFAVRASTPKGGPRAVLARDLDEPLPNEQTLRLRVRVPPRAGSATSARLDVAAKDSSARCTFELRFSDTRASFFTFLGSEGVSNLQPRECPLVGYPGNGSWFQVALVLTASTTDAGMAAPVVAEVSIDGAPALAAATVTDCSSAVLKLGRQRLEVGAQDAVGDTDIVFDDIVFDGK